MLENPFSLKISVISFGSDSKNLLRSEEISLFMLSFSSVAWIDRVNSNNTAKGMKNLSNLIVNHRKAS